MCRLETMELWMKSLHVFVTGSVHSNLLCCCSLRERSEGYITRGCAAQQSERKIE
jgi:hypothetical protein